MALLKAQPHQIPPDAIRLSEDEALKYQLKVIRSWKNKSDTFAFRYGAAFLGCLSTIAGVYINNHYRVKFKLMSYGRVSSYLPICVLPMVLSVILHTEFVSTGVVLQKSCTVCIELRSAAIQAMTSCVLPTILAPLSATALAVQYNTYDVPYITKEPMKVFRLWHKQTKPVGNILFAIFLGQALIASTVTYFESKSVQTVNNKLAKLEYDLEQSSKLA